MTDLHEIELWVAVNEDGDCEADTDEGTAHERLIENYGGYNTRMIKLTLKVPLPKVTEATIEVPEEGGTATVTVTG